MTILMVTGTYHDMLMAMNLEDIYRVLPNSHPANPNFRDNGASVKQAEWSHNTYSG